MNITTIPAKVLAGILWVATVAWGLVEIYFLRQTYFNIYARFSTDFQSALLGSYFLILILSIAWLAFVIGTAEYHRKFFGQYKSWRLFGITIAVEAAIMLLYFVS